LRFYTILASLGIGPSRLSASINRQSPDEFVRALTRLVSPESTIACPLTAPVTALTSS